MTKPLITGDQLDITTLDFSSSGLIEQGLHTIWIPAVAMTPDVNNPPETTSLNYTSSFGTHYTLQFDETIPEYCWFTIQLPKSWDESTINAQVLWTSISGAGNVVWQIATASFADGGAMDSQNLADIFITDTSQGNNNLAKSPNAALNATSPASENLITFRIARDAANGSDTLVNDAALVGIRLQYNVDAGNDV